MARSLERAWEEKLRAAEAIEQEYQRWRSYEPLVLSEADRNGPLTLGEDFARHLIFRRPNASTSCAYHEEVIIDQKRLPGQVWIKIVWRTGATSDHSLQRRVHMTR